MALAGILAKFWIRNCDPISTPVFLAQALNVSLLEAAAARSEVRLGEEDQDLTEDLA